MAQPAVYDQIYASLNGALLAEAVTVKLQFEGDDQDVFTLAKGWSGQTPSPRKLTCTIEEFVPPGGFEFDFVGKWLNSERVTLGLQFGASGLKMQSDGFIRAPGLEAGAGQSSKLTVQFTGEAKSFT